MCPEKGLDGLVEAYIQVRQRGHFPELRLRIGGSCGPADDPLVQKVKNRLSGARLLDQVEFWPNLNHRDKIAFLKSLTVFSVPALYGEAFGLYVIEALAAGVPVVQPRTAAFPEVIEATGGGVLCTPGDPAALADGIEGLLREPDRARSLGKAGCQAVNERFNEQTMVAGMCQVFDEVRAGRGIWRGATT
jgi:glycosyltransferase involved in cell wall biosynthesis